MLPVRILRSKHAEEPLAVSEPRLVLPHHRLSELRELLQKVAHVRELQRVELRQSLRVRVRRVRGS